MSKKKRRIEMKKKKKQKLISIECNKIIPYDGNALIRSVYWAYVKHNHIKNLLLNIHHSNIDSVEAACHCKDYLIMSFNEFYAFGFTICLI